MCLILEAKLGGDPLQAFISFLEKVQMTWRNLGLDTSCCGDFTGGAELHLVA